MESFCADQARELVRRGYEVQAVVPPAERFNMLAARFEAGGTPVHRFDVYPERTGPERYPSLSYGKDLLTRLIPILRSWQPNVVHLHRGNVIGGLPIALLTRIFTKAVMIYTDHDVPIPELKRRHWFTTRVLDYVAHSTLAVSRRNARYRLSDLGAIRDKFASILNGIPIADVRPEEQAAHRAQVRQQLAIEPDAVVIGCLVRLVEGKGLETLFRAFAQVRARHPAILTLVGHGPLQAELERLASELGVSDSVRFAGFHPNPTPFLDAMDIFALAVPAGSMSIALLEAMARGLPPVITFCGPEEAVIHEETGLCATPNDPDALAEALERFVADQQFRKQLGQAAAAHVRTHFSIARCMDDHLELYTAAPSGKVPRRLRADGPPNNRPGGCPTERCMPAR